MKINNKFRLIAAPFTPFKQDLSVDTGRIPELMHHLCEQGIDGVFINGSTGEGMSLTLEERMDLAHAWVECCPPGMRMIIHVGHSCLVDARKLAQHAQRLGAESIAATGPCFYPAKTPEQLIRYCAAIAEAAPRARFYYYHIPALAKVLVKASDVLPGLKERIPNFGGIKFTHEDLEDYSRCLELAGEDTEVMFGRDELLLSGIERGATAAVGSTYNFSTALYRQLIQALQDGDTELACKYQQLATDAIALMGQHGGLAAAKVFMRLSGFYCGGVRLPLISPAQETQDAIARQLAAMGYTQYFVGNQAYASGTP